MTIIAYTKGILASDTKAVDEQNQVLKTQKLFRLGNGSVIGTAGNADIRDMLAILDKASLSKLPTKLKLASHAALFKGLWLFPGGELFRVSVEAIDTRWEAEILPILDPWAAVGSGSAYALGAMVAGKTAVEAVRIACRLDNNCGMPSFHITLASLNNG